MRFALPMSRKAGETWGTPRTQGPLRQAQGRLSTSLRSGRDDRVGLILWRDFLVSASIHEHMASQTFDLQQTIAVLERTPAALNALLRGLPDHWTRTNEGSGTWSVYEVIGHLIFGELTDWLPRARVILAGDESRSFEPFDRVGYKDQSAGKSLEWLLDEFARLRGENLATLRKLNLQPQDLGRRARHPALGSVTLSQLLATWAVHDLTHLHQISRVMAQQYREVVGPWSAFLGVLQCNGHSA